MDMILDILSWILISIGGFFCITGAIGVLRLPDIFTRMHAQGLIDTGGVGFMLTGFILQSGFTLVSARLFLLALFIIYVGPSVTYLFVRSLLHFGYAPTEGHEELLEGHELGHEHDAFEAQSSTKAQGE